MFANPSRSTDLPCSLDNMIETRYKLSLEQHVVYMMLNILFRDCVTIVAIGHQFFKRKKLDTNTNVQFIIEN